MDLERLIDRHKDAVYRELLRVCGNATDAEDALADAILAALKASDQLRDPANLRAWLARVGSRVCVRLRIRRRIANVVALHDLEAKGIEIPSLEPDPGESAEMEALKDCVSAAMESIPELFREVYFRREILGEPAEVVAKELGITIPALKSRLHRARKIIRESLDSGLGCGKFLA